MASSAPEAGEAPRGAPARGFLARAAILAATGFGLGLSPVASGTCGALLGIPLALGLTRLHDNVWLQIALAGALTLLAIPICDAAERHFGKKDDGRIVADEYMLLPICFIGRGDVWARLCDPATRPAAIAFVAFAFVVSRIVDILKPTPCRQIQRVEGGLGVVLDDFFASLYSWFLIWGLSDYVQSLF